MLFDTHCHLQFPDFDTDRESVLERMEKNQIGAIVVGTDLATSKKAVELAAQHDFLWASVGFHPNDNLDEEFDVAEYESLARDPKVVAVGECGLDFFRTVGEVEYQLQRERFRKHIELAAKLDKTLIIHCRPSKGSTDAHDQLLAILKETREKYPDLRAVAHFFTSTRDVMERYLALRCYISFPSVITFTDMYDEAVGAVPLDRVLIETDSPFAAPQSHRGGRNEPSYVVETAARVAAIKGLPTEEIAMITTQNARKVFRC